MYSNDVLHILNLPRQLCSTIWLLYGFFNMLVLDGWYMSVIGILIKM